MSSRPPKHEWGLGFRASGQGLTTAGCFQAVVNLDGVLGEFSQRATWGALGETIQGIANYRPESEEVRA